MLEGVSLLGDGSVSDMLWARPAVTILGIDCPPVVGSAAAIVPKAAARLNLRIPPGMAPEVAEPALVEHLRAAAPWGVHVTVEVEATGAPFEADTDGPAYRAMADAMQEAYGRPMATPRPGRVDPAVQRVRGDLPRRRDHPDGRRGAAGADPRPERERRPDRDRDAWR